MNSQNWKGSFEDSAQRERSDDLGFYERQSEKRELGCDSGFQNDSSLEFLLLDLHHPLHYSDGAHVRGRGSTIYSKTSV